MRGAEREEQSRPNVVEPKDAGTPDLNAAGVRGPESVKQDSSDAAVDERLALLHKLLASQLSDSATAAALPTVTVKKEPDSALSGARAPARVRRRSIAEEHRARVRSHERTAPEKSSLIEDIRCATDAALEAQKEGLDAFRLNSLLADARTSAKQNRKKQAARQVARAERELERLVRSDVPFILKDSRKRIQHIRKLRGNHKVPQKMISQVKQAIARSDFSGALGAVVELRKRVRESEREILLRHLLDSKERFALAKRAGLDVGDALALLDRSRESLLKGDLDEAVSRAKDSRKLIDAALQQHHKCRLLVKRCIKTISLAEGVGADVSSLRGQLEQARKGSLNHAILTTIALEAKKAAEAKGEESLGQAERSIAQAKDAGAEVYGAEETFNKARLFLAKGDVLGSILLAASSVIQANSSCSDLLSDRLRSIDQFARSVEGEVESLSEVHDAIAHSKERSLEEVRRNAKLSEDLVCQAYESAAAYTRVSQDIVKQTFESSMAMNPMIPDTPQDVPSQAKIMVGPASSNEDRRLRIIDLYLAGKITEPQLDRLLTLLDSSIAKVTLV